MEKNYEKVEFFIGESIETAVNKLLSFKEKGILVCGDFNGTILYSDTVTMDDAYLSIAGKTKAEFDKAQQEWREEFERKEKEHEAKIPQLSEEWSKKGREILSEDKWERWDKIVPIRLGDMYRGMELGASLDIIQILNSNGTLDEAKEMIENQGHSGASFGLVCGMVKEFCERGSEFVDYVYND